MTKITKLDSVFEIKKISHNAWLEVVLTCQQFWIPYPSTSLFSSMKKTEIVMRWVSPTPPTIAYRRLYGCHRGHHVASRPNLIKNPHPIESHTLPQTISRVKRRAPGGRRVLEQVNPVKGAAAGPRALRRRQRPLKRLPQRVAELVQDRVEVLHVPARPKRVGGWVGEWVDGRVSGWVEEWCMRLRVGAKINK